jgi:hypothetical protein
MPIDPLEPAGSLKFGRVGELGNTTQTKIGYRDHRFRKAEYGSKIIGFDDADPANPHALRAPGEPEVLDGANSAV